jgi:hypothetical protein
METHKCNVVFKDPNVGEFMIEITGNVDMPQPSSEVFRFPSTGTIFVDEPYIDKL